MPTFSWCTSFPFFCLGPLDLASPCLPFPASSLAHDTPIAILFSLGLVSNVGYSPSKNGTDRVSVRTTEQARVTRLSSQAFIISPTSFRLAKNRKKKIKTCECESSSHFSSSYPERLREYEAWAMAMLNSQPGAPSFSP